MPSTASISRWLKTSLTQNSEELIADEVPEPFILICRIETPHHRGTQKWLQCGAQNYGKDIKKPVRFYTTPVRLFTLLRFYASTLLRFYASTLLRPRARLPQGFVIWDAFQRVKNVDRCTATQKKSYPLAETRCFVLLPLNQQLLVTKLETNNSKDHRSP